MWNVLTKVLLTNYFALLRIRSCRFARNWGAQAHGCLSGQQSPIFLPYRLRQLRASALRQLPSNLLILLHKPS